MFSQVARLFTVTYQVMVWYRRHLRTWPYFTLHFSTMALLHSTLLYISLPWLYFILQYSTFLYHGSTSFYITLHFSTMALLHSTLLYISVWYTTCMTMPLEYHSSRTFLSVLSQAALLLVTRLTQ